MSCDNPHAQHMTSTSQLMQDCSLYMLDRNNGGVSFREIYDFDTKSIHSQKSKQTYNCSYNNCQQWRIVLQARLLPPLHVYILTSSVGMRGMQWLQFAY